MKNEMSRFQANACYLYVQGCKMRDIKTNLLLSRFFMFYGQSKNQMIPPPPSLCF